MSKNNDGGAAFPVNGMAGMSLRDYFAAAGSPSREDIVAAAGLKYDGAGVSTKNDPPVFLGEFANWWLGLSDVERQGFQAKARYALADAMLSARAAVDS